MRYLLLLSTIALAFTLTPEVSQAQLLSWTGPQSTSNPTLGQTQRRSVPGKYIYSETVDPLMSAAQEAAIFRALNQPYTLGRITEKPLAEVVDQLNEFLPVGINHRALEDEAMDAKMPITYTPPAWFARSQARQSSAPTTIQTADRAPTKKWWQESSRQSVMQSTSTQRIGDQAVNGLSNLVALTAILDDLQLTYRVRAGQLTITTITEAEETSVKRLYNVTPLTPEPDAEAAGHPFVGQGLGGGIMGQAIGGGMGFGVGGQFGGGFGGMYYPGPTYGYHGIVDPSGLMEQIERHIDLDCWENMGGPSTMSHQMVGDQIWLVISTTNTTHLKIEAFLHQLNL